MIGMRMAQQMRWDEYAAAGLTYAFIVTHEYDLDADADVPPLVETDDGEYGPADAAPETVAKAKAEGQPWRLLDGDGIVCAQGVMWASDSPEDWTESEAAFTPLDDFGRPAFGATTLQYQRDGEWVDL